MKLHGKNVYCACGKHLTFVKYLERQRGRGKCVKLSTYHIIYNNYYEEKEGEIKCYCGRQIGHRQLYSEDIILIPIEAIKQTKSSVHIDVNDEIFDSDSD